MSRKNIPQMLGHHKHLINIIAIVITPHENTMKSSTTFSLCLTKNNFLLIGHVFFTVLDSPWEDKGQQCGHCHLPLIDTPPHLSLSIVWVLNLLNTHFPERVALSTQPGHSNYSLIIDHLCRLIAVLDEVTLWGRGLPTFLALQDWGYQ